MSHFAWSMSPNLVHLHLRNNVMTYYMHPFLHPSLPFSLHLMRPYLANEPLFWLYFSSYLIPIFHCFYVRSRWARVKLTLFHSYCTYSGFCLTFRKNVRAFVEKKALGMNSSKNRCPTNLQRTKGSGTEEGTTMRVRKNLIFKFINPKCKVYCWVIGVWYAGNWVSKYWN